MDEQADFIAKLVQIEEQAHLLVAEGPSGLARTRAQHIILLTPTLKGAASARDPKKPPA